MSGNRRTRREKGAVIVLFAVAATTIIGAAGLSFDIGRMYMVRNESQEYADAGALAAVVELNGTQDGLTAARNAARGVYPGGTNLKWKRSNFGNTNYANADIVVEFGTTPDGPWLASPSGLLDYYQYAKVTASTTTPVFLARILTGRSTANISASAVAGQVPQEQFNQGLWPFGFFSRCLSTEDPSTCANFGMVQNEWYTFAWSQTAGKVLRYGFESFAKGAGPSGITDAMLTNIGNLLRLGSYGGYDIKDSAGPSEQALPFCPGDTTNKFFRVLIEKFASSGYFTPDASGNYPKLANLLTDRGFYYKDNKFNTNMLKDAVANGYQTNPWNVGDAGNLYAEYQPGQRQAVAKAIQALIRADANLNPVTNGVPPSSTVSPAGLYNLWTPFATGNVNNYFDGSPAGSGERLIEAPIFDMSGAGPPYGASPSANNTAYLKGIRAFILLVNNDCPHKTKCSQEFYTDNPGPFTNYCASFYGGLLNPIESKPPATGGVFTVRLLR